MQINFENSRLAYVTACSSLLTCAKSLDLKELDRIIHHVYESYSEYNRKNAGRGALTDSQPPFRRFLLKEGFSWNSQLSMYTNYGRFIDVFQRFVSSTVETSGLSEMQEKELRDSFFDSIDEKVSCFTRGQIAEERNLGSASDIALIISRLCNEQALDLVKCLFLARDPRLKSSLLLLPEEKQMLGYIALYQLIRDGNLEEASAFNRAISIFIPDRWSTSVDFYRTPTLINETQAFSRLDESKAFLIKMDFWLEKNKKSAFKSFLIQEGLFSEGGLVRGVSDVDLECKIKACMEIFYLFLQDEGKGRETRFAVSISDLALLDEIALTKKIPSSKEARIHFLKNVMERRFLNLKGVVGKCFNGVGAVWGDDLPLHQNYNEIKKAIYNFLLILYETNIPQCASNYYFDNDMVSLNRTISQELYNRYSEEILILSGPGSLELRSLHESLASRDIDEKMALTLTNLRMQSDVEIFNEFRELLNGGEIIFEYKSIVDNLMEKAINELLPRLVVGGMMDLISKAPYVRAESSYLRSIQLNCFLENVFTELKKRVPYEKTIETMVAKRDIDAIAWLLDRISANKLQQNSRGVDVFDALDEILTGMIGSLTERLKSIKRPS